MDTFYTIIAFLFGVMIGWVCMRLIRMIDKVTYKFVSFIVSILSGGTILYLADADKSKIWFHLFGLVCGWCLWLYLAKKHGAPADVFYSRTRKHNIDSYPSQSDDKNKKEIFY